MLERFRTWPFCSRIWNQSLRICIDLFAGNENIENVLSVV